MLKIKKRNFMLEDDLPIELMKEVYDEFDFLVNKFENRLNACHFCYLLCERVIDLSFRCAPDKLSAIGLLNKYIADIISIQDEGQE